MLPGGVANHFPTPSFGTLERLIVGEIARTRFNSTGDEVTIPRQFEVALSDSNWETVQDSPEYFLSDTATAAEELANRRGWVTDGRLAIRWITRADVPNTHPRVIPIGLATTPGGESLERLIATGGGLLNRAEVEAKRHRPETGRGGRGIGRAGRVLQTQPDDSLLLEPLQADIVAISMPPHMHELVIGRGENADVVIDHRAVSRRHCAIRRVGDEFVVSDLGSTNGTRLNGTGVGKGPVSFEVGDVLELGGTVFYRRDA